MENYFEDVYSVLDKITKNRTRPFKMNLKAKLYLGVLMNKYRNDIIARETPDFAIKIPVVLVSVSQIKY